VNCIYIDPPYNTGDSEILYKNQYLRSCWLSLMENRIALSLGLLADDPVLFIAIDDFEMGDLSELVDKCFTVLRREMIVVNHHPQGGKAKTLASTHEYMLACVSAKSARTLTGRLVEDGAELRPFKRSGTAESNFRYGRPNSFYAILVDPESKKVVGLEPPPAINSKYPTAKTSKGLLRVYPLGVEGEERVWRRSYESCLDLIRENKLRCTEGITIYQVIEAHDRTPALFSNWVSPRYNAGTYGANLLKNILGERNPFSYPKSIHTVEDAIYAAGAEEDSICLDYFGGSGTTGHAVINLNREDGGQRKYILAEVGDWFESVLLTRLKKVVFCSDWKDGKPVGGKGVSHLMKYQVLEQYEDTLNNLELPRAKEGELALKEFGDDYLLRYMLEFETAGSASLLALERIKHPFAYRLKVQEGDEIMERTVDLIETFNYLLGLHVKKLREFPAGTEGNAQHRWSSNGVAKPANGSPLYRAVLGEDRQGRSVVVIWRDTDGLENNPEALTHDRQLIESTILPALLGGNGKPDRLLVNQPFTGQADAIEPEFHRLMFAPLG
jgi:adenine-specific DNA-methyltransferase